MTQQNAALVEESAAAASSLREQAHRLADVVSVFNVGHQQAAYREPAKVTPAAKAMPAAKTPVRHKPAATRAEAADSQWASF